MSDVVFSLDETDTECRTELWRFTNGPDTWDWNTLFASWVKYYRDRTSDDTTMEPLLIASLTSTVRDLQSNGSRSGRYGSCLVVERMTERPRNKESPRSCQPPPAKRPKIRNKKWNTSFGLLS